MVPTVVGGPFLIRGIIRVAPRYHLTNNDPSSAFISLARTFFILVHSMWMVPLSGGVLWGVFFGFFNGSLK